MTPARFWLGCLGALLLCTTPAWSQPAAGSARSYTEFGIANGKKGDFNGAIAAFDAAVEIDPKFAPAYYFRGMARESQKDITGAVADFSKTIEIDPTYSLAYYHRGTIEGQRAKFDDAVADFQQTIKLDPKNSDAYYNIGHVYYFRGDLDGAMTQINTAIDLNPQSAIAYYMRGLILRAQGHRDEASKDFQKSLGLNFPYASFWYWMYEMENGQHGLAEADLTSAQARPAVFQPGDWPSNIADLLLGKISSDQLVTLASQGDPTEVKDRQCEAYFYSGVTKHFLGDDKAANDLFEKSIDTDSEGSEEFVEAKRWLKK